MLLASAAVLYAVLALLQPVPVVYPDESLYGNLAASIGHGDGFTWRLQPADLRAALYPILISPAWMLFSNYAAYTVAKLIGVVAISTTAIPVWLILRRVAPPWVALAAGALTLSGTWMIQGATLATETFSLPLATASLCATVAALRNPGGRYAWVAMAFAVLAAAARIQCVVLLLVILGSLLLDMPRAGRDWRARARAHRWPILVLAVVLLVGAVAYEINGAALVGSGGSYDTVTGYRPAVGETLRLSGVQALVLAVSCGMLPLAIVFGCMMRPAAWRDDAVGPMLAVVLPGTLGLSLQSGFFFAGLDAKLGVGIIWTSQRYVYYAAPLIIATALLATARPRMVNGAVVAVAAGALLALFGVPGPRVLYEERAMFAVVTRVHGLLPHATAGGAAFAWAGATAALWAVLWHAGRRRGWRDAATGALIAALGVGMVAQSATAWHRDLTTAQRFRAASPADLQWIDHHSRGPVAVLIVKDVGSELAAMELLNRHVGRVYISGRVESWRLQGPLCAWGLARNGRLAFEPSCAKGQAPRQLLIEDPRLHMTFYDEGRSFSDPHVGRLVTVGSAPRIRAVVKTPCERIRRQSMPIGTMEPPDQQPCLEGLDLRLSSDTPGEVHVRFRGAPSDEHTAVIALHRHRIPAGRITDIVVPVPRGYYHRELVLDWTAWSASAPKLLSVELVQGAKRISLL